jgi:hypothetical protein
MPDSKPSVPQGPRAPITEETARQIITLQTQDLAVNCQELELRKEELIQGTNLAEAALAAQTKDRSDGRRYKERVAIARYCFFGGITVLLLGFASWALYLNKDAIVIESLKIIGPFVIGGVGGYYVGRAKQSKPNDSSSGSDDSHTG